MTVSARPRALRWLALAISVALLLTATTSGAAQAPPLDRPAIDDALTAAYHDVDAEPTLRERVIRAITDLLVRAFAVTLGRDDALGVILGLVALAVLAVAGWWLYRRLGLVAAPRPAVADGPAPRTAVDWARRATEARRLGDLETAVRAGWSHLLHLLDERGIVREAPSLTASEAAAAARRAAPRLGAAVDAAAAAYEHVVFAATPATTEHDRDLRHATQQAERA